MAVGGSEDSEDPQQPSQQDEPYAINHRWYLLSRESNQTQSSWIEALGADPDRVEFFVNGQPYSGALEDGATVELKTKANEKGC